MTNPLGLSRAIIAPPCFREQKYSDRIFLNITRNEPLLLLASVLIKLSEMTLRLAEADLTGTRGEVDLIQLVHLDVEDFSSNLCQCHKEPAQESKAPR